MNKLKKIHIILFITLFLFNENCILRNLSECGKFDDCKNNNRRNLILSVLYRLSNKPPRPGISIPAVNLSGADDNPAVYESFSGRILNSSWNEQKVRDILQEFAYGGGATDADITAWVNMGPSRAIVEIIGMWSINSKLAVASVGGNIGISPDQGSLSILSNVYGTNGPATERARFDQKFLPWSDSPSNTFSQAVATRGLNPVRQKIAFFESNYHLALNQDKSVSDVQMFRHYDTIANDIARSNRDGLGFEDVLANIALTAPVATQYNHKKNVFENGIFKGNEDFAREYHQLYFGILGVGIDRSGLTNKDVIPSGNAESFNDHETITISQTACALTDIQVPVVGSDAFSDIATFGTSKHCPGALKIYATNNTGNTAEQRIKALSKLSINHPESKNTLPLIIVAGLADENLDAASSLITNAADPAITTKITAIRKLWTDMPKKNLIEFIRKYAISDSFHNTTRLKYMHTVDRTLTNANTTVVTNQELLNGFVRYDYEISSENIRPFRPEHDVFGGQTGLEASNTDDVFRNAHNTMVSGQYGAIGFWTGNSVVRLKDYRGMLPKTADITTLEVARFLWRRLLGDSSFTYFGKLEEAHLVSILASGKDLTYYLLCGDVDASACPSATSFTSVTQTQVNTTYLSKLTTAAAQTMFKSGASQTSIDNDNERVGSAVDFILATPFNFVHVGRQ